MYIPLQYMGKWFVNILLKYIENRLLTYCYSTKELVGVHIIAHKEIAGEQNYC